MARPDCPDINGLRPGQAGDEDLRLVRRSDVEYGHVHPVVVVRSSQIVLSPMHGDEHISMAMSLVTSTRGIILLPEFARNFLAASPDRLLPGGQVPVIFRVVRDCEADRTTAAVGKRRVADHCMRQRAHTEADGSAPCTGDHIHDDRCSDRHWPHSEAGGGGLGLDFPCLPGEQRARPARSADADDARRPLCCCGRRRVLAHYRGLPDRGVHLPRGASMPPACSTPTPG